MTHVYRILLATEEITISPVQTVERTTEDYTFFDAHGGIIAMFERELVKGFMREASTPVKSQDSTQNNTKSQTVTGVQNPTPAQTPTIMQVTTSKNLATPRHQAGSMETGVKTDKPTRSIHIQQNRETKAYEVHSHEIKTAHQEIAATATKPLTEKTPNEQRRQGEQIMQMTFKKITAVGVYNPETRNITVEKGTLIISKESNSLRNAKNQDGVRAKRRAVLRKQARVFDDNYHILTEDITFSSLSQACRVLSGTIISPNQYWQTVE